jgi:hypothetical protein
MDKDKKLLHAADAIKKSFDRFHQVELAMVSRGVERLRLDANGQIANTAENMAIRASILEQYRNLTNQWITENMAPADWIVDPSGKIPNPLAGQAVLFGKWYAVQGLAIRSAMTDLTILENIRGAAVHVSSVAAENRERLRRVLTTAIVTPAPRDTNPYRRVMDVLGEKFGLSPGVAETVFRGTVMQTLRMTAAGAASEATANTEPGQMIYQHVGPPPVPMPDGHEFCVAHYGEYHTLDEWEELARQYHGQGGTDPDFILEFVGGYNCRHVLQPVLPDNVEMARDLQDDYKGIQQEYLQHLQDDQEVTA